MSLETSLLTTFTKRQEEQKFKQRHLQQPNMNNEVKREPEVKQQLPPKRQKNDGEEHNDRKLPENYAGVDVTMTDGIHYEPYDPNYWKGWTHDGFRPHPATSPELYINFNRNTSIHLWETASDVSVEVLKELDVTSANPNSPSSRQRLPACLPASDCR